MQVILSYFVFFLIYFTIQVLLYRFFKINLNKLLFILFSITVSVAFGLYFYSIELLMFLININLMIICFYTLMPGIINNGPGLEIIYLISKKKINKKKELKKWFLKSKISKAVEKRLNINISSNLLKLYKGHFFVKKNTEKLLIFLNFIKKIYRLKTDAC